MLVSNYLSFARERRPGNGFTSEGLQRWLPRQLSRPLCPSEGATPSLLPGEVSIKRPQCLGRFNSSPASFISTATPLEPRQWKSGSVDKTTSPRTLCTCPRVEIKDTVGMGLVLQHPLFFSLAIWRERATGFTLDHCYTCEQGLYIFFFKDTCSQNNTVGLNWLNLFDCVYLNQNYYFSCIARWLDFKFHL